MAPKKFHGNKRKDGKPRKAGGRLSAEETAKRRRFIFDHAKKDPKMTGPQMKAALQKEFGQKMQPPIMFAIMRAARQPKYAKVEYEDLPANVDIPAPRKGTAKPEHGGTTRHSQKIRSLKTMRPAAEAKRAVSSARTAKVTPLPPVPAPQPVAAAVARTETMTPDEESTKMKQEVATFRERLDGLGFKHAKVNVEYDPPRRAVVVE